MFVGPLKESTFEEQRFLICDFIFRNCTTEIWQYCSSFLNRANFYEWIEYRPLQEIPSY